MKEIKAPNPYGLEGVTSLFTAGSIEQGAAENWQSKLVKALSDMERLVILNPRRSDWDSSWKQEKNDPQFRAQVEWELIAQENVDVVAFYYDPKTKSPITLMEMGLFIDKPIVVYCPEGYFRKGNVDIVCERYRVPQANSWDEFVALIRKALEEAEKGYLEGAWK
jgi:hypothetical protein